MGFVRSIDAIKTWRYLRLAMIILVFGLFVSIVVERLNTDPGCFQASISAYYYTPARGYLVGALVAIGVCLICLKGNTETEDVLLNLAGMFAPVIALVPTPSTGSCASLLGTTLGRDANIANNVTALLSIGLVALMILAWMIFLRRDSAPTVPIVVGYTIAVAVWFAALLVFVLDRGLFVRNAHYTAAVLMFVCMLAVVAKSPGRRYAVIAIAMVVSSLVILLLGYLGWDYWLLALESTLIALFAVFWAIQTDELWDQGLRDSAAVQ